MEKISELALAIYNRLRNATQRLANVGYDEPIGQAFHKVYKPAEADSLQFLADMAKLLGIHGAQAAELAKLLRDVDSSATYSAGAAARRR